MTKENKGLNFEMNLNFEMMKNIMYYFCSLLILRNLFFLGTKHCTQNMRTYMYQVISSR